jgi:hypothetical protein
LAHLFAFLISLNLLFLRFHSLLNQFILTGFIFMLPFLLHSLFLAFFASLAINDALKVRLDAPSLLVYILFI